MALTTTEITSIAQILLVRTIDVKYQINYMGDKLTAEAITAIQARIALWDAGAGTDTVKLHPTESNKGVETNAYAVRRDIQQAIAILLMREDWMSAGSTVMGRVQRG